MCRIVSRGNNPNCTACRESENTPVIKAWDATIVAAVATITKIKVIVLFGASAKNGFEIAAGSFINTAAWPR